MGEKLKPKLIRKSSQAMQQSSDDYDTGGRDRQWWVAREVRSDGEDGRGEGEERDSATTDDGTTRQ